MADTASGYGGGNDIFSYRQSIKISSLSISNDNISVPHTINFCTPVPTNNWVKSVLPETKDCGIYQENHRLVNLLNVLSVLHRGDAKKT